MKYAIIILAVATGLVTCRKKEKPTMVISGSVTDKGTGSGVSGATITIRYKPYKDGVFTTTYTYLTSTTTDGSGNYSFDIEKPNTSDFQFLVTATSYFGSEKVINPDNLSTSNANSQSFQIDASGTVQIHLKNNIPFDENDFFQFQTMGLNYSCSTCCSNSPITKTGSTVDTTFTCDRYANRYLKYTYFKTKNGITTPGEDSIYCPKGVTTNLEVLY
jgi:hypothetical protein